MERILLTEATIMPNIPGRETLDMAHGVRFGSGPGLAWICYTEISGLNWYVIHLRERTELARGVFSECGYALYEEDGIEYRHAYHRCSQYRQTLHDSMDRLLARYMEWA